MSADWKPPTKTMISHKPALQSGSSRLLCSCCDGTLCYDDNGRGKLVHVVEIHLQEAEQEIITAIERRLACLETIARLDQS